MAEPWTVDPTYPRLERRFDIDQTTLPPPGGRPKAPYDPERYHDLTDAQKRALAAWIGHAVRHASALTPDRAILGLAPLSYFTAVAFQVPPGAFYGGLMAAGHYPTLTSVRAERPLRFQIAPASGTGYTLNHLTVAERAEFDALVAAAKGP